MVDRIWYEWQNKDPNNKYAFAGGSLSGLIDADLSFAEYPNGGPPFLNVRGNPSARDWSEI
jgi:tyrosinase